MIIYCFSIFVTGKNYTPLAEEMTDCPLIHVSNEWLKGETFVLGNKRHQYGYSGTHYTHKFVFATNETERGKVLADFISFLERECFLFWEHGAEEINIKIVVYISERLRFVILTKQEMERLLLCGNIVVSVDLFPMKKSEIDKLKIEFLKERSHNENI